MSDLSNDIAICIWTMEWAAAHGRRPTVSELPAKVQAALGKKVFEFLDYRDKHRPDLIGEFVYKGCLNDHGVDRDEFDGFKQEKYFRRWGGHPWFIGGQG